MTIDLKHEAAVQDRAYWKIDSSLINHPDAQSFEDAFILSLERCWDTDRTAGVQLSGGVDSSLVCILSGRKLDIQDYPTYSVLFDDNTANYYLPSSEERYIKKIADLCNLDNHAWTFTADQVRLALSEAIWYNEQPLYGASRAFSDHSGSYPELAKKLAHSVGVKSSMISAMASHRSSTVRAAAFLSRALSLAKACSMGLKSGE